MSKGESWQSIDSNLIQRDNQFQVEEVITLHDVITTIIKRKRRYKKIFYLRIALIRVWLIVHHQHLLTEELLAQEENLGLAHQQIRKRPPSSNFRLRNLIIIIISLTKCMLGDNQIISLILKYLILKVSNKSSRICLYSNQVWCQLLIRGGWAHKIRKSTCW